jgi:kynurenine formamidase
MSLHQLIEIARDARLFDLSQPLFVGMPHFPTHSAYLYALAKEHGEFVMKNGGSSASETITLSAHCGTHIDAFNHFSCAGRLFGGEEIRQSVASGVRPHSVDTVAPVVRRGVLLDVAGLSEDGGPLPGDFAITPEHLEEAALSEIRPGDVVLIRTGWGRHFRDPRQYVSNGEGVHVMAPGPDEAAAKWLSARKVFAAGSDTLAFEKVPSPTMPVHVHLLFESGIHIIENLDLEQLAAEAVYEFLFVAAPLKIEGGTGSPVRAFALA